MKASRKSQNWCVTEMMENLLFVFFFFFFFVSITKTCLTNILKILPPKNENFQIKNSNIFHISAQNIDCG